jgi:sec-independent protein translocase protein TatB
MFDLDVSKLAVIGAVALVVIGPEKMPRVARTIGTFFGKAQRYISDVKAEVNRTMEATSSDNNNSFLPYWQPQQPEYKHPGKNWRLKRSAMPHWYKARQGVRTKALSGAARVARFRPAGLG